MSFKVINLEQQSPISITDLTPQMIQDLITCYSCDVTAEDVESRYLLTKRTGITPSYSIISKSIVQQFYDLLDLYVKVIIDVINGNYTTNEVYNKDNPIKGLMPTSIAEVKYWVFFIIKRDFFEQGTWIFDLVQGDFESLRPFIDYGIDLFFLANDHGDFNYIVNAIHEQFTEPQI